ncbi:unnamed protein product, partial [Medioppia subpectinata]
MDWKNTLMILAALALHCTVFGALMRPLNVHAEAIVVDDSNTRTSSRKPLLQRIAEEKRRRLMSHSNSQILLMMQNNCENKEEEEEEYDEHDTITSLKNRLFNTEPGVHSTLYLDQLFSPPTPQTPQTQQLSPILERKVVNSENSSPQSCPGSPTEDKDLEMQLQDSAISLSGELTFPSSTTIAPQSPTGDVVSRLSSSSLLTANRVRRQTSARTMSESSNSAHTVVAAPTQPLQVILTSGTPTHSAANKNQTITVRPIYKRDIFYSGSTLTLPPNSSLQHIAESQGIISANMGQSVVSIPARDIIHKVHQQLAQMESEAKDPAETHEPNLCGKLLTFFGLK